MKTIFVFGSNLAGIHGAGAARAAYLEHGAIFGVGWGPQGNAYAIPTKDEQLETLPLHVIKPYVDKFIEYAKKNSQLTFNVTRVGCGLAGYKNEDIAPMFKDVPFNCVLSEDWVEFLEKMT